jgi:hypothetical protein
LHEYSYANKLETNLTRHRYFILDANKFFYVENIEVPVIVKLKFSGIGKKFGKTINETDNIIKF